MGTEEDEISDDDLLDGFDYKGLSYMLIDGNMWVYDCTNRNTTKVTIPSTITVKGKKYKVSGISEDAFYNLKKLKTVTIGSNVKVISGYAFYGCEKLKTVKIGKNVTKIKTNAFANCKALKKITIPSKVKEIGKKAFYKCSSLKTITIKGKSLKKVGKNAFTKLAKKATIKVPKSKKKTYTKLIKVGKGTTIK